MSWTTPQDLKAQVMKLWARGDLLRDEAEGRSRFPLRLSLRGPASKDVTERFESVRAWASALANSPPLRVEWQEVRHRVQGTQCLPACVWVDSLDAAVGWLGLRREYERFCALLADTRRDCPALLPWVAKRPLQALALIEVWPRLLAVIAWLHAHPRPDIHLRQADISGVHSKFIEAHRGVLSELLDLALPSEAIDSASSGLAGFVGRYGFRDKPLRIRLRVLDPTMRDFAGLSCPDVTLDADSLCRLALNVQHVLITENETNYLALPPRSGTLAIFGAGYGWDALARAQWLNACAIHYWGDIDTHGFAILDQLRSRFAHVESLMMDRATLDAHEAFWGSEERPQRADLPRLHAREAALYDDLRDNRIRPGLRLEQEHIGFGWVLEHLERLDS